MYPNLKLQLWKSGIRQNRLARQLGVDETVLSRIVNGFREPNSDLQGQIAAVLKCDAQWLFSRQNDFDSSAVGIREPETISQAAVVAERVVVGTVVAWVLWRLMTTVAMGGQVQ